MTTYRRMVAGPAVAACLAVTAAAQHPKFFPDDPVRIDDDQLDVEARPAEIELSDLFDRFGNILVDLGAKEPTEAQNVNTLDEVPDSAWFTNRHGAERLSLADLRRGPNTGDGPDMGTPWRIFRSKIGGVTPGFQMIDGRGDRYIIKFDPPGSPELSSAAEIIGTKLFHAIGYHTPENYVVTVDPETGLTIEPGTMMADEFDDEVPLTPELLRRLLRRFPRLPDGRIRIAASKYLEGQLLGPFRYYGTRSDDPNDVVPHEHRRELRGLRLFAAWTNHDDTRAQNTQDSWVEVGGLRFVRHYLIDFGSAFGSAGFDVQPPDLGFQYWLDLDEVKRNALSFGLRTPAYRKVDWPNFPEYGAVGRWEAKAYDPATWHSDYPNPAFVRMTDRDGFWAAKIIMRFTPEELRAIVATGEFSDPRHAEYFFDVLVERQRKTTSEYLNRMNPVDDNSRWRTAISGSRICRNATVSPRRAPSIACIGRCTTTGPTARRRSAHHGSGPSPRCRFRRRPRARREPTTSCWPRSIPGTTTILAGTAASASIFGRRVKRSRSSASSGSPIPLRSECRTSRRRRARSPSRNTPSSCP